MLLGTRLTNFVLTNKRTMVTSNTAKMVYDEESMVGVYLLSFVLFAAVLTVVCLPLPELAGSASACLVGIYVHLWNGGSHD